MWAQSEWPLTGYYSALVLVDQGDGADDQSRVALPNGVLTELQVLPANTIELGMGAHGEPGLQQISPVPDPAELTEKMLNLVTNINDSDRAFVPFSPRSEENAVVLLVNSLGSTSDEVLGRFAELGTQQLERQGFKVERLTLGPLVTSLKMSGFGFTLWRLPAAHGRAEEVLSRNEALILWDSPVHVVAWRQ